MSRYDFEAVEARWAQRWIEDQLYTARQDPAKQKYFSAGMLPYPSGSLHMGHVLVYSLADSKARLRRMQGYSVLNPIGWDSFGLPAENAAIKHGVHPAVWTRQNIENGRRQLKRLGFGFDWSRELSTCDPAYYRWTQWLFLLMYRHGLAERREGWVNWCPSCSTVLANEQVEQDGTCWRCGTNVTRRRLTQWFYRITDFAQELWDGLERLQGWPGPALAVQRNWIGRSEGMEIRFAVEGRGEPIAVFTTRPDTVYGVTFLALAPEHELVTQLAAAAPDSELARYVAGALDRSELERLQSRAKTGVDTGLQAAHPLTGEPVPIWVSDYVLALYGTGAVMGVPAHDTRDMEFAQTFGLEVRPVIAPADGRAAPAGVPYTGDGVMVNSGAFDGQPATQAAAGIRDALIAAGRGQSAVRFKLRDWLISRQRYWGCPIPIIYCDGCGALPVPEGQLPVLLPEDVEFLDARGNPLESSSSFVQTACPRCGGPARRETDTMDTFMDSSWYIFRYLDPHNSQMPFDPGQVRHWLPLDYYVGLIEHAGCHMIYFRFFVKMLHRYGLLPVDEPVHIFFNNGTVKMGGHKMSKSRGNLASPDGLVELYGADALRFSILSDSPPDQDVEWNARAIQGVGRYVQSLWATFARVLPHVRPQEPAALAALPWSASEAGLRQLLHSTIQKVEADILGDRHNTAIAAVRSLSNAWQEYVGALDLAALSATQRALLSELTIDLLLLLAPLMPFFAEELWSQLGQPGSIHQAAWPEVDRRALAGRGSDIVVQINGRKRKVLTVPADAPQEQVEQLVRAEPDLSQELEQHTLRRVIYVPNRLINYIAV
jgi:leucyl-tRNA synthetase